jgi:5-methylcytosine-specific restriction protein A
MPATRIADLPFPVTAAKADWLVASHWIGFTPLSDAPDAEIRCQNTVAAQFGSGYVIEYITRNFGTPNTGFESDSSYLSERSAHADVAGKLIAIHRLLSTARPLKTIVGPADFERIQDMWAEDGRRRRWSVAFPIVETYDIINRPYANQVLTTEAMQRLFAHPSATLRPLNDSERNAIANLSIAPRSTVNAWIAIEGEIGAAEGSVIDKRIVTNIEIDLRATAMEGMTAEQRAKIRLRAAWLAQKFVRQRQKTGRLTCDKCSFDPTHLVSGTPVKPRSLLDVHHLHPLEEGVRITTLTDFTLLCPTCHRFEHALLKAELATR